MKLTGITNNQRMISICHEALGVFPMHSSGRPPPYLGGAGNVGGGKGLGSGPAEDVAVGAGVAVDVGVLVAVGAAVAVGVGGRVGVGVSVGVGVATHCCVVVIQSQATKRLSARSASTAPWQERSTTRSTGQAPSVTVFFGPSSA